MPKSKRKSIYPTSLLRPVASMLRSSLKKLELRRKDIEKDDPFNDPSRTLSNASPDTDAEEQFGHARAAAIREQLDRKMIQTRRALSMVRLGNYGTCSNCGKMIDTDRLMIYPEATHCVKCKAKKEKK